MNETVTSDFTSVIPEQVYLYLHFALVLVCMPVFSFIGVFNNGLNQLIFVSQGLKEHVTFTLYCLSLTDFLVALSTLGLVFTTPGSIIPLDIGGLLTSSSFSWLRVMLSDIAVGITVFISIERSCCVAFPFTFNLMFNISKSRIIILFISTFVIVNYIPVYTTFCYYMESNPLNNLTFIASCPNPYSASIYKHIGITFGTILSLVCEVTTFISVVVMHVCLRKSSQLRFLMTSSNDLRSTSDKQTKTMSRKEERAVRMVLVVAVIYLLTSLPKVTFNLSLATSEEMLFGKYYLVANSIGLFSYVTGTVNGCFHLFVFYRYSSTFRQTFRRTFFRTIA